MGISYHKLADILNPNLFSYYAMDKSGKVYAYSNKPVVGDDTWRVTEGKKGNNDYGEFVNIERYLDVTDLPESEDWYNSLRAVYRSREEWCMPLPNTPIDTPVWAWVNDDWRRFYWAGNGKVFSGGLASWTADGSTIRYNNVVLVNKDNPTLEPPHIDFVDFVV